MTFDYQHILDTYYDLKNRNSIIYYQGPVLYAVIAELSHYIRNNISEVASVREKVFYIFIELAQNIRNYSAEKVTLRNNQKPNGIGLMSVSETPEKFTLIMGNLVSHAQCQELHQRYEQIISLDRKGLRELKSHLRSMALTGDYRSGNIGLVDVALKSGNPLEMNWIDIDDKYKYYFVSTSVSKIK